ncbi:MAG: tetratricopeptide repeat protein [Deltaproteobacteria bacterium]|nr:tetratricopeptide repeat protein [Deltaproteobacteria bacterium]
MRNRLRSILPVLLGALALFGTGAGVDPRVALKAGVQAREAARYAEAREHLEKAVEAAPTWVLARLELADALLHLGAKPGEVGQHLEAARLVDEGNPRLHLLMGLNHEAAGQGPLAAASFETALELRPSLTEVRLRLGRLLLAEEKAKEAAEHLAIYVEAHPEAIAGQTLLAQALEAAGDLGGAERALRLAAERFPDNAYNWQRLADFHERHGQSKKAAAARAQAEKVSPRQKRDLRPLPKSRR